MPFQDGSLSSKLKGNHWLLFHQPLFPYWQVLSKQVRQSCCFASESAEIPIRGSLLSSLSSGSVPSACSSAVLVASRSRQGQPSQPELQKLRERRPWNRQVRMDCPTLTLEPLYIGTKVCILLGSFLGIKAAWWCVSARVAEPLQCHGGFQDLLSIRDNRSSREFVLLMLLGT